MIGKHLTVAKLEAWGRTKVLSEFPLFFEIYCDHFGVVKAIIKPGTYKTKLFLTPQVYVCIGSRGSWLVFQGSEIKFGRFLSFTSIKKVFV